MSKAIIRASVLAMSSLAALSTAAHAQDNTTQAAPEAEPQNKRISSSPASAAHSKMPSSSSAIPTSSSMVSARTTSVRCRMNRSRNSLVRIPGLTANGDENGFTEVSVRGLGPDLANSTYNGRILPSTRADNRRLDLGDLRPKASGAPMCRRPPKRRHDRRRSGRHDRPGIGASARNKTHGLSIVARGMTNDVAQDLKGVYGFKPGDIAARRPMSAG